MDWKPMAAWPFNPGGGVAEPYTMQLPARVRKVIDPTYWDNTSLIPIDVAAGILLRQYIPDIANFVQRQRQRYSLGLVEYHRARATAPQLVVDYINNNGQEIITYIVQPTTSSSIQGGGTIIVGGDPRNSDGATMVWFNEGPVGLAEYANNSGAKIHPDFTGLTFTGFGDGTTPVPSLPASCINLGIARGNWSVASWSYTQDNEGDVHFVGPTPSGNIIYDKKGIVLATAPNISTGLAAGIMFFTDTSTAYSPSSTTSYGALDFTGTIPPDLMSDIIVKVGHGGVTQYVAAVTGGIEIIDGGRKYLYDGLGNYISDTSILPSNRDLNNLGAGISSVQDSTGNSYLLERNTDNGNLFATKRDKDGALQWSFSLNYEDLNPVGIARGKNFVAVLISPPTNYISEGTPSWGINVSNQPGLFTPPFWTPTYAPYASSAAAAAVIAANPDTLSGETVFTRGFAGGYPGDGHALVAFLTAAQNAIDPMSGILASCIYGSNSNPASILPLPSKILVLSEKDGKIAQTISWGTATLDIIPIPSDVSASVVSPHGLRVAASAPNY